MTRHVSPPSSLSRWQKAAIAAPVFFLIAVVSVALTRNGSEEPAQHAQSSAVSDVPVSANSQPTSSSVDAPDAGGDTATDGQEASEADETGEPSPEPDTTPSPGDETEPSEPAETVDPDEDSGGSKTVPDGMARPDDEPDGDNRPATPPDDGGGNGDNDSKDDSGQNEDGAQDDGPAGEGTDDGDSGDDSADEPGDDHTGPPPSDPAPTPTVDWQRAKNECRTALRNEFGRAPAAAVTRCATAVVGTTTDNLENVLARTVSGIEDTVSNLVCGGVLALPDLCGRG